MLLRQAMSAFWLKEFSRQRRRGKTHGAMASCPGLERLEDRSLMSATANLVAYRPVTQYIDYSAYPISEADEVSATRGAGIRFNGDDDNRNETRDYLDKEPANSADNDLVRVDALGSGTTFVVTWTGPLNVWTSADKASSVTKNGSVNPGQSLWVEYITSTHTTGTTTQLQLTASDGLSSASDSVVFHSFQSITIAIGGNTQDPAKFGDSNLGTFTMAGKLYGTGYDVQMFAHGQVQSTGKGAAYDEVVSAVLNRNVDNVAIYGYSWGGGATYELSVGLNANTALAPEGYKLRYTAYIDAIRHNGISSETRKPVGTAHHDNFFQRKDFLLKGNSVSGANNINVTNTTWGKNLAHTSIDDNLTLHGILLKNLTDRLIV